MPVNSGAIAAGAAGVGWTGSACTLGEQAAENTQAASRVAREANFFMGSESLRERGKPLGGPGGHEHVVLEQLQHGDCDGDQSMSENNDP